MAASIEATSLMGRGMMRIADESDKRTPDDDV